MQVFTFPLNERGDAKLIVSVHNVPPMMGMPQPPTPALQPATPDLHAVLTHFGRVACLCGILILSLLTIACSPSPYAAPAPDLLSTQHLNQVINNIKPL